MQSLVTVLKPVSKKSLIKLIVVLFFLFGTFFLGVETWNIQQSCTPMFVSKDASVLSEGCSPPPPPPPPPAIVHGDSSPPPPPPPPPLLAIVPAAITMTALAITGAPVAVVAGVGIAVWFIFSSAIKAMKGN